MCKDSIGHDIAGCARKHFWSSWRMKPWESTDHCWGYLIFQYKASEDFLDSSKSFTKFEYIEADFLGAPL